MTLFYLILTLLNVLGIPYELFEDLSFDVIGYAGQEIPPAILHLIALWYQSNDRFI